MDRAPGVAISCAMLLVFYGVQFGKAQDKVLFQEDFRKPLAGRWRQIKFHAPTKYQIETNDSNACVEAVAGGGCSALATKVAIAPGAGIKCSWSWKIDHCPTNGTDYKLKGFDHAARVFIAFDTWLGPPRTINYVWANRASTNSTFTHPFSSRTKFIAVESGSRKAGRWLSEQRDVQKDWNRLFKGEPMPKIVAVGVFTDSYYTQAPLTAWYKDIVLEEPEE